MVTMTTPSRLSLNEVALRLGCSPRTAAGYVADGLLSAIDISSVGAKRRTYRIASEELERFVAARTVSVPLAIANYIPEQALDGK